MEIYLNNNQNKIELNLDFWESFINKVCQKLKLEENTEVSITFVDNKEMRKLNRTYRKIDKATDVLSFPFDNSFNLPVKVLGDIVISAPKAVSQSKEYQHSLNREIGFLMVHGLLHLIGYDHETPEQENKMFSLQKNLLQDFDL